MNKVNMEEKKKKVTITSREVLEFEFECPKCSWTNRVEEDFMDQHHDFHKCDNKDCEERFLLTVAPGWGGDDSYVYVVLRTEVVDVIHPLSVEKMKVNVAN